MPSAYIARLYMAALGDARQIGGALVIVQAWAWSRIPVLWPQLMTDVQADLLAPLGAIWDQLDFMPSDQHIPDACDTCLDLNRIQLRGNDNTYWGTQHASHVEVWHQWRLHIRDGPTLAVEEPPSSPSQMAVFAKKVQTIIRRCMRGEGSGGGHPPVDPFDSPNLDILSFSLGLTPPSQSLPGRSGTLRAPPPPGLEFVPFHSPHHTYLEFLSFRAPPPPGTTDSSTSYQPISQASSSDKEERTDDTDDVQYLGFGHRVGKKTTRFTSSDWP
ncbi:hypothetical protein M9H77_29025 [Catharanthus roseus]|uniref:Uncharacterized protein n=1 Tax=Catharanthus roseus TaxID=4058 RepID=A0ACC0AIF2_CATRO|nr:hypothetical protein M9H77_29025 [Catharanthus roseus]